MKIAVAFCALAILTTGCSLFDRQERRINYTERLDEGGPSLINDAKQHATYNMKAKVGVGDFMFDDKGQVIGVTDNQVVKNHPNRIICAEPSPDVAQAISAAFTAAAQVDIKQATAPATGAAAGANQQASGSGSLGSSYASSIAQLGERLATVQLLRDKMYRACEAYQNGAISDTSYTLMLARFDKTMASMLASEVAAGAFGRNLAALGGSASTAAVDPKRLADARDAVKGASGELQTAAALPETDDAAKEKKKKAVADASTKLNDAVSNLAELEFQNAATYAQSGPAAGSAIGQIAGRTAIDADAVTRINTNYLDDDASGTIIEACVTALDRNRAPTITDPKLLQAIADKITQINTLRSQDQYQTMTESELESLPSAEKQKAETAKQGIRTAEQQLADLLKYTRPSLGGTCAAILQDPNPSTGLIATLQNNKLALRKAESELAIKQIDGEIAVAQQKAKESEQKAKEAQIKLAELNKQSDDSITKTCSDKAAASPETDKTKVFLNCVATFTKLHETP